MAFTTQVSPLGQVTYNDFKRLDTIDPEQFDKNFQDVVSKIDEVINSLNSIDGTNMIVQPLDPSLTNKLQDNLIWLRSQIVNTVLNQVPDGSITNIKLGATVKVGDVSTLSTTAKSDVVSAINELVGAINTLNTNMQAANLLSSIKTVDGRNSGLDADLVRGRKPYELGMYNKENATIDSNNISTITNYKRLDNTMFMKCELSNPTVNGQYQTDLWTVYDTDGVTIINKYQWTYTYDSTDTNPKAVPTNSTYVVVI